MRILVCVAVVCGSLGHHSATAQPGVLPPPGMQPPEMVEAASPQQAPEPADPLGLVPAVIAESPPLLEEVAPRPQPVPDWYHPNYWFGPAPWDIGFDFGINGNQGINESLSLRVGGHLKRDTEFWKFDNDLVYNKNTANSIETQNNALLNARLDRKLGDSRWSLFFLNQNLYDEFQTFDLRVSLNSGIGYQGIDTETIDVVGSFGAGASKEFGAIVEHTAYEALFELNYEYAFSPIQRFSAKVDYFAEWEAFSLYRVVTDMGWEIDLDRPKNMSLKFSVVDRYDSTPNGVEANEVNYAALLIWGL